MAAKPIERFVKRQIADQGGWPHILERIASGETYTQVANSLRRPDGLPISFAFFRRLLHQDPTRESLIIEAKRIRAEAWVDAAMKCTEDVPADRDEVAKARVFVDTRFKAASFADREQYGEAKQGMQISVNVASWHIDALRHRIVEASRPLAEALDGASETGPAELPQARVEQVPTVS